MEYHGHGKDEVHTGETRFTVIKVFIIGGMGAGKSAARKALLDEGAACVDLDELGHEVLCWQTVKDDLANAFGNDVFDEDGNVDRKALALRAFANSTQTRLLNRITMPRIEDLLMQRLRELEAQGCTAVVVEFSVFKGRATSLASIADIIVAITAPEEVRIQRAVEAGWDEQDVRRRIAQQITDAERIQAADVVFENTGSKEELYNQVKAWWRTIRKPSCKQ